MSDDHLLNTLKLLQRQAEVKRIHNSVFYALDPGPSADMAQLAFEQEQKQAWDSTWEHYVPEIYFNLEGEVKRRGLTLPQQETRIDIEVDLITKGYGKKAK